MLFSTMKIFHDSYSILSYLKIPIFFTVFLPVYYLQKILIQLSIIQKSKMLFSTMKIFHDSYSILCYLKIPIFLPMYYLQKILIQLSIIQKSKILPKLFNSSLFKNSNIVHNIFTSVQFTENFNSTSDYSKIQDILHHLVT